MLSGPLCQNNRCKYFQQYTKDSIIKLTKSKNKYVCKECKKEFEWSMPKKKYGIIY